MPTDDPDTSQEERGSWRNAELPSSGMGGGSAAANYNCNLEGTEPLRGTLFPPANPKLLTRPHPADLTAELRAPRNLAAAFPAAFAQLNVISTLAGVRPRTIRCQVAHAGRPTFPPL